MRKLEAPHPCEGDMSSSPVLEAAPSFDAILKQPVGRYACEGNVLYYCVDPKLTGMAVWGRPAASDFANAIRLYDFGDQRHLSPECAFILDLRKVEVVDAESFGVLEHAMRERTDDLVNRVRRIAFVRPDGVVGAVMEGFFGLVGATVEWRAFFDVPSALGWLERPDLVATLEELMDAAVGSDAILLRLRAQFATSGFRCSLEEAAQALGLSARSLQRSLGAAGLTFRQALDAARLARAEQLLCETDLKLAAIAERVGFATGAHFSTWWRSHHREPPSAFRKASRARRLAK